MQLSEFLQKGSLVRFETVRPLQKILLVRNARDGVVRNYVGTVKQLRKPNAYIIDMQADLLFEDGVHKPAFKSKEISFRNSSDIHVYLLEEVSVDTRKRLAEERRAYAQARRALSEARQKDDEHFLLLGVSRDISKQEFRLLKKKIMLKWHPDKKCNSELAPEEFDEKSKKFMDALSYVGNYIDVKQKRIS